MAITDKNILITPNIGQAAEPKIDFVGASATLGPQTITLNVYPENNGTLSFEGSAGQLFSVTNDLTGTIFSVNDVSGIPSIEVLASGVIRFAEFSGNVLVGTATDNGTDKLQISGDVAATTFKGALSGNATTATTLQTARAINGTNFDGSAAITTANWGTARTISIGGTGKSVNGSANYTWATSEIAAQTAVTLATARTINGVSFNGSSNITVADATKLPLAGGSLTGTLTLTGNATSIRQSTTATWSGDAPNGVGKLEYHSNRWYINAGADSTLVAQFRRGGTDVANINNAGVYSGSIAGNATTATTLQTTRAINGTNFNGSANITTANWGTARTLTIGSTGKSVNGSANVAWSLAEIGAAPLASPAFTGAPTAPTPAATTNTTRIATTAYVSTRMNGKQLAVVATLPGTPDANTIYFVTT